MLLTILLAFGLSTHAASPARPWNGDEHRILADSALQDVLREFGTMRPMLGGEPLSIRSEIWDGRSFTNLAVMFARDDSNPTRHHAFRKTVYEQLEAVSLEAADAYWQHALRRHLSQDRSAPRKPGSRTAVSNFLIAHLTAIRFAQRAGDDPETALAQALLYEAMAQGYLADAHSAGHMRVPRHDALQAIHPVNNRKSHDLDNVNGVFVINGWNQAWQAFGDGTLTWYARSYRQVRAACAMSLREVLMVYAVSLGNVPPSMAEWASSLGAESPEKLATEWLSPKVGQAYYETVRGMPSLSSIPVPISATWSLRTQHVDPNGIRTRVHFPQFREVGFHEEGLPRIVSGQLYPKDAFPKRFSPFGSSDSASASIPSSNVDVASVEFVQLDKNPADYAGVLASFDFGLLAGDDESSEAFGFRIGDGIFENAVVLGHLSMHAGITVPFDEKLPTPVRVAAAFNLSSLPLRLEYGVATTTEDFLSEFGTTLAAELDLFGTTLGLTYLGLNVRLRYSIFWFDETLRSPSIQLELQ